jgi:predicted enzyme related to lactoylglutathione lyase
MNEEANMARVTGIGGVFFKAKGDKKALAAWYEANLGVKLEPYGAAVFKWPADTAEDQGATAWVVADPKTDWFGPSESSFMINYRVDDMAGMLERLGKAGVPILKGPEAHENGKFAWVMDPEGNKVELWEPMLWDEKNAAAGSG